jgi:protein MpaA
MGMSAIDPMAIAVRFDAAARAAGFRVEKFGKTPSGPLLALTKRTAGPRPRIYLSAGIHGDEPAPPLALLRLIERGLFDARAVWFICPLLNPAGLARGTRENTDGLDLNRDYRSMASAEIRAHVAWLQRQPRFDLAVLVHEDWEAKGFYLYEVNRTQHRLPDRACGANRRPAGQRRHHPPRRRSHQTRGVARIHLSARPPHEAQLWVGNAVNAAP